MNDVISGEAKSFDVPTHFTVLENLNSSELSFTRRSVHGRPIGNDRTNKRFVKQQFILNRQANKELTDPAARLAFNRISVFMLLALGLWHLCLRRLCLWHYALYAYGTAI